MRDKTQLVELDLRGGLFTNESPYAVGPRLRQARNTVFDYRYPRTVPLGGPLIANGPWMLRQPLTFPTAALTAYPNARSFRDIAFTANGGLPVVGNGVLLIGCNLSDQYSVWGTDGQVLPFGATTRFAISNTTRRLGCSTSWASPGFDPRGGAALAEGITVFSHASGTHVYYLLDAGVEIRSLTSDVANCLPGAAALAVHLDRLWMVGGTDGTSLRYTDPFDVHTINPNNEILIADRGTCLIPGQLGTVDSTGVPHLVIGNTNGVQVLDGDPNLGNAALRMLAEGIGMASSHVAAVTPYGVYFVGTDADLYQIPLGMQEVRSVGGGIRDRLGINNVTGAAETSLTSLVWFNPYLYLYPGGETSHAYVLEPTRDGIGKAWGPVTLTSAIVGASGQPSRPAVVRATALTGGFHAPSGAAVSSVHSIDTDPSASSARYLAFDQRTTVTQSLPGRTASIVTGLVNLPHHAIQPMRVLLETVRVPQVGGVNVTWTVTITDERGSPTSGVRVPNPVLGNGTFNVEILETQHFVFPQTLPAMRGVSVTITATTASDLALVRAFVEVKPSPLQF